jgi:phosphoglycolate phosphatase-like HAD superfamily hydrolase
MLDEMGTAGPIDGYRFDGKTDPQIVRELLKLAEHPECDAEHRITAVCDRYVDLLTAELAKSTQATRVFRGVRELLDALQPHEAAGRVLVGLLTGNLQRGAALKLRSAGIDPERFAVGAYGSDSHYRPDLPAVAAQRAAARTGRRFHGRDIVVVGDTPDDIACARPLAARTVAVATGFFKAEALRAAGADYVFDDLGDTPAVLDALLA